MRLMIVIFLLLMSVSLFAQDQADKKEEAAGQAGMVVTLDGNRNQNGEMPEELREALNQMVSRSTEGLKEEAMANGGYSVDLKGRFMSAMVITVDEQGEVQTECFAPDDARINHDGHVHTKEKKDPK